MNCGTSARNRSTSREYASPQVIDATLAPGLLEPGGSIVLAADAEAFRRAYGSEVPLAEIYRGRLSNAGEILMLSLPSPYDDVAILRFSFDDAWQPSADGGGHGLEFRDLEGANAFTRYHPRACGEALSWTASLEPGGSPAGFSRLPSAADGYTAWESRLQAGPRSTIPMAIP